MRTLVPRARDLLRRGADVFPITTLGVLVIAGSALALLRYGVRLIDHLLLVVGAVGLALGVLTLLTTSITALVLWAKLRKLPEAEAVKAECGFPTRTGFSVSSLWFIPFVKVQWSWESPEATVRAVPHKRRLWEEVTPTRRILGDKVRRRVEVSDAFGLTRVAFRVTETRPVRFVPSVGSLRQMHVVRSIAGGDNISHPAGPPEGERVDIRHYAQGDPIKFVLWKVFARTRQLVIRTPERAISPVRQTVAYVVTGEGDEPAAGAARVAVDSGALGSEWVLGADGADTFAKSAPQALELLAQSANTPTANGGHGLGNFLDTATSGVGRAVVFVPGTPGPWLDKVLATVRARTAPNQLASPVEFVVCTDGIARAPRPSWFARWLLNAQEVKKDGPSPTAGGDVAKVVGALASARTRVMVVDRLAGRVYAEGHTRGLEAQ